MAVVTKLGIKHGSRDQKKKQNEHKLLLMHVKIAELRSGPRGEDIKRLPSTGMCEDIKRLPSI